MRKSASQLVPSSLKAKPKNSKCGPSKSQNTSSTKYRCLALDGVKCRVMIRKGRIHRDARRYAEAREALVVAQELRAVRRLEQMELCGAMANLRLQEIRNFLTGNQSFELFEEAGKLRQII